MRKKRNRVQKLKHKEQRKSNKHGSVRSKGVNGGKTNGIAAARFESSMGKSEFRGGISKR